VRLWLSSTALERSAIPQPAGAAVVHTAGTNPARVLLIGSGAAIGYGVLSHELALAGHLARQLSIVSGRAIDMDIVVDREMTAATMIGELERLPLARYDIVIVNVGLIEALGFISVAHWRENLGRVFDRLRILGHADQQIFAVGIPPLPALQKYPPAITTLVGRHARLLNTELELETAGRDRVAFLPFEPPPALDTDRFRSSSTYSRWAELISAPIAALISTPTGDADTESIGPLDELARQSTLDALQILDTAPEERFDRITLTARDLLGTTSAAITFVDRDRHWFKSRLGVDMSEMPRFSSLCDITIQRREHFVIENAAVDPRFADNPMVVAEPHLRFYAGYPIEAPNGVRVGTLSVFDPNPRTFSEADAALLRGLALMVQNELRTQD
jgi:hypothetical protein